MENMHIVCPIRGQLKVTKKSKDGLTPREEFYRVEAIKYLIKMGYPKENFLIEPIVKKFGNNGRNSFRSDFAILKKSKSEYNNFDPDELMKEVVLLCEVKKDNAAKDYVKMTQVKPMLDFAKDINAIGLYWDNIEHRVFWNELKDGIREIKEGPLSFLPKYGTTIEAKKLTFNTLIEADSLLDIFSRIEDILHQASFSPENRYEIILKLLLAKIFDEHAYETRGDEPVGIQDYSAIGTSPTVAVKQFGDILKRAVSFYEKHLPNPISADVEVNGDTLLEIMKVLAPIKIIHSKRDVVQSFYMKFAKSMYKWDLAQYFTPSTVTDFIMDTVNPQFGEHIADPACGSADFLVAAFRIGRKYNPGFADCIWGVDNSANAVQVAVLNMVLNGDGKTNIKKDDSLQNIDDYNEKYSVVVCNPPFGSKIVETRTDVLKNFELAYEWEIKNGKYEKTDKLLKKQETGILFVEACVRECKKNGRIAIILPNGYLGNRSDKFAIVRQWVLKHTKIAAIVSLPRFTFKSSGADVSASVVFLEKKGNKDIGFKDKYSFAVEMIEKVGWDAGNKKAAPLYVRAKEDGCLIIDENNEPIIDSDFSGALKRIVSSKAAEDFPWLAIGREISDHDERGWDVNIEDVYSDEHLTIDPKRLCKKFTSLREKITAGDYFKLGDVVDFIPEKTSSSGKKIKIVASNNYNYTEIQDIGHGEFYTKEMKGWELPSRARHFAEEGDIYFGSIWGSAVKWCYISSQDKNVVITNGCFRTRIKEGKEQYLPDILTYMNSEGWAVQMRAFSRGSDGLAEICEDDAKNVFIPKLSEEEKAKVMPFIQNTITGRTTLYAATKKYIDSNELAYEEPNKRPSHIVLV